MQTVKQKVRTADGSVVEINVAAVEEGKTIKGIGSKPVAQKRTAKAEKKAEPKG